jgi:subtilisin family serine protease
MTGKKSSREPNNVGSYLWRNGQRIDLEKAASRFTVMLHDPHIVNQLRQLPGIESIQSVTDQIYKVNTAANDREDVMNQLRSDEFGVVAHHAYHPKDATDTTYYLTDKIIVQFSDTAEPAQIQSLINQYHLVTLKQYEGLTNTYLLQVTDESGGNPLKIANQLMTEAIVVSAEPNLVNRFQSAFFPTDSLFQNQWHLNAEADTEVLPNASIDVTAAWEITRGERSIVVAVMDDGFDLGHPDFQGENKLVNPKDYVPTVRRSSSRFERVAHHGTSCAGLAIAECNGTGVVGVAPGCAFMPVRFPFSADDDLLIEIFQEMGKTSDVISCSWGPPPVLCPLSNQFAQILTQLATTGGPRGKGCVICFAASNFNAPINDPVNANGFTWVDSDNLPKKATEPILNGYAAHPNVIAVAASTSLNQHAAYSNWGAEVSVCAPSNNVHPLTPAKLPGLAIWTTADRGTGNGSFPDGYTGDFGGTSSATPIVAGVAALVLSVNPELSAAEVKEILQSTADRIMDLNPDVTGVNRGVPDASGRCDWFGYGKVNAAKAVAEAQRRKNQAVAVSSSR